MNVPQLNYSAGVIGMPIFSWEGQASGCTVGDFTYWPRLLLSLFAEAKLKLNTKVCT